LVVTLFLLSVCYPHIRGIVNSVSTLSAIPIAFFHTKDDLSSRMSLRNELRLWKREWAMIEDKNDLPKTIENTIQKMNVIFYPNTSVDLRLLLKLTVSSATIERSHSFATI
jgi:hypothetical protein